VNEIRADRTTNGSTAIAEVLIDGMPLQKHFVGAQGAHPDLVFTLSCIGATAGHVQQVSKQLLGDAPSPLPTGRVPVLVCSECGDIGCGAITVRITLEPKSVLWSDWKHENGYEPESDIRWPTFPRELRFDLEQYRNAIGGVA